MAKFRIIKQWITRESPTFYIQKLTKTFWYGDEWKDLKWMMYEDHGSIALYKPFKTKKAAEEGLKIYKKYNSFEKPLPRGIEVVGAY